VNLLALDMSTKTGWATNAGRQSGVQVFDVRRGESPGMRFLRCRAWLNEIWKLLGGKIDVICYEQAHHRGGAATACCVGLVTTVLAFAAEHNIETMPVHTGQLKKWATGKGNAGKPQMIQTAKARGWSPADDNEADAQLLLEYAIETLGLHWKMSTISKKGV
jgi:Holliday junction resolvasome RuvABC endonuclease subunit